VAVSLAHPSRFFLSYDASQASPRGQVFLQLITFSFTLNGIPFTRNEIFQGGQVILRDGKFENVTASFQVRLPPNSPVNNITFGFGGDGVIGYIDLLETTVQGRFISRRSLPRLTQHPLPYLSLSRRGLSPQFSAPASHPRPLRPARFHFRGISVACP